MATNVVELDPWGTVTELAGAGSKLLLLEIDTAVALVAAPLRPTVHVVADPEFSVVGLQAREDSVTELADGARVMVAVCGVPLGTTADA